MLILSSRFDFALAHFCSSKVVDFDLGKNRNQQNFVRIKYLSETKLTASTMKQDWNKNLKKVKKIAGFNRTENIQSFKANPLFPRNGLTVNGNKFWGRG